MLAVEPLLRARLAELPGLTGVHSLADLDLNNVAGKRLPALFVASDGYRVVEQALGGARVASRWLIVVAVRQVADVVGGSEARAAASDLARAVFAKLYRWQPSPDYQPLIALDPPRPEYNSGLLLFPLAFEAAELIKVQA